MSACAIIGESRERPLVLVQPCSSVHTKKKERKKGAKKGEKRLMKRKEKTDAM
jgi:hypothetical protein